MPRSSTRSTSGPWEQLLARDRALGAALLDDIYRHAAEAYPDECCGFVRRNGEVHRAVNHQDALHAEDSTRWPQSARDAYSLSPDDLYLLGMSFLGEAPAIVVYHSHPDVGAYFSKKDAAGALHGGRPIYDVDHLVVDVRGGRPYGAKLFRFVNSRYRCVWFDSVGMSMAKSSLTKVKALAAGRRNTHSAATCAPARRR